MNFRAENIGARCWPRDPLADDLPLGEALLTGGEYLCEDLGGAVRALGRWGASAVHSLRGDPGRLTVVGIGGAVISDPDAWGGNGRQDVPYIRAAAAALGKPDARLSTAIIARLPARSVMTHEARTIAQAGLPPPFTETGGPCAVVETGGGRYVAGLLDVWAPLALRLRPNRPVTREEAEAWAAACEHKLGEAQDRGRDSGRWTDGEVRGLPAYDAPCVVHLDMASAYASFLRATPLRRTLPIVRPAGWYRPGGDTTGLIPGRLDTAPGALNEEKRRWPIPKGDNLGPAFPVQVETAPDPHLTDAVGEIFHICEAAGGRVAVRAAGRTVYGILHGRPARRFWTQAPPPGAWPALAGRYYVEAVGGIAPFCEPAAAWQVLDGVGSELVRVLDALREAGYRIIQADTDGLICAGPPGALEIAKAGAPPWAIWRQKWNGHMAYRGLRRYLCLDGVVWSGLGPRDPQWQRMHSWLQDAVEQSRSL